MPTVCRLATKVIIINLDGEFLLSLMRICN